MQPNHSYLSTYSPLSFRGLNSFSPTMQSLKVKGKAVMYHFLRRKTLLQSLQNDIRQVKEDVKVTEQYKLRFGNVDKLYGNDQVLQKYANSHICVIGLGGVGSWVVEALARSGIGRLTLIDMDEICPSNINRQVMATTRTVGKFKGLALKERVEDINPDARVNAILDFITADNVQKYLTLPDIRFDYVIDCIDVVKNKAAIIQTCVQANIPVITSGGVGGLYNPKILEVKDLPHAEGDKLLFLVRRKLRDEYGFPQASNKRRVRLGHRWNILAAYSPTSAITSNDYPDERKLLQEKKDTKKEKSFHVCDSQFGNACFFSGSLGFLIASEVLNRIALNTVAYPNDLHEYFKGNSGRSSGMYNRFQTPPNTSNPTRKFSVQVTKMTEENMKSLIPPATASNEKGNPVSSFPPPPLSDDRDDRDKDTSSVKKGDEKEEHPDDCNCGQDFCQFLQNNENITPVLHYLIRNITSLPNYDELQQPLFDAHCHLQLSPIYEKNDDFIPLCLNEKISHFGVCGTCPGKDWDRIQKLSQKFSSSDQAKSPIIIPNYGLHPWWIREYERSLNHGLSSKFLLDEYQTNPDKYLTWIPILTQYLEENPYAGVGECGLDKNIMKKDLISLEKQIFYFTKHVTIACQYHRTLTIHGVSGCWGTLYDLLSTILKEQYDHHQQTLKSIIFHGCQSLPVDMIKNFEGLSKLYVQNRIFYSLAGSTFSASPSHTSSPPPSSSSWNEVGDNGSIQQQSMGLLTPPLDTRARKLLQLIKALPLNKILIESDSPDQVPNCFRYENYQHASSSSSSFKSEEENLFDLNKLTSSKQKLFNLPLIIKFNCLELAKILNHDVNSIADILMSNSKQAYGLDE